MTGLAAHLREAAVALAETFRNPSLRRLQLAAAGSTFGSMSCWVAIAVYAYGHGGARGVALVGIVGLLPSAVSSPFAASLADRFPRRVVMIVADVARAILMGAIAATIALGGPVWTVYTILAVSSIIGASFSPARAALLPTLARTPAELTAANVAASTIEGAGSFLGPAVGGFLVAATSTQLVFALNGASFLWSAALVLGIRETERPPGSRERGARVWDEITAGFRTILGSGDVRVLVLLFIGQTLVSGALNVLVVVTAFDLLHGGPKQVGLLDASAGVGGLIGAFAALALSARGRLAADFALGLFLFGSLALIGAAPDLAPAVIALGVFGIGNSLVDVAAFTLLQRTVPNEVLGRVFGALEGILLGAITVGTIAAPGLIDLMGTRASIIAVGAVLPVLTIVAWPRLRRIDTTAVAPATLELLRAVEIFAPLPLPTLERLARSLTEVHVPAGSTVIRKGDAGDRFYVVEDGVVEVEGKHLGPGSSFGEIALLRDVPRTATVTAESDVILRSLDRDEFLAAVTESEPSRSAAEAVIAQRLGAIRGG